METCDGEGRETGDVEEGKTKLDERYRCQRHPTLQG